MSTILNSALGGSLTSQVTVLASKTIADSQKRPGYHLGEGLQRLLPQKLLAFMEENFVEKFYNGWFRYEIAIPTAMWVEEKTKKLITRLARSHVNQTTQGRYVDRVKRFLLNPIMEEGLFRGVIQTGTITALKVGAWGMGIGNQMVLLGLRSFIIFGVAMLFGMIHDRDLSTMRFTETFIAGMVYGILMDNTLPEALNILSSNDSSYNFMASKVFSTLACFLTAALAHALDNLMDIDRQINPPPTKIIRRLENKNLRLVDGNFIRYPVVPAYRQQNLLVAPQHPKLFTKCNRESGMAPWGSVKVIEEVQTLPGLWQRTGRHALVIGACMLCLFFFQHITA